MREREVSPGSLEATASNGMNYTTTGILLLATASHGNMTISSNKIIDKPVISTNWLLDGIRRRAELKTVHFAKRILKSVPSSLKNGNKTP